MKHLLKDFVRKEFPGISYSLVDLSHVNFFKRISKTFPPCANITLILNDNRSKSIHEDSDSLLTSWHREHMFSHKSHYSFFSRRQSLSNICEMQKDPLYPVIHFPKIRSKQITMEKSEMIELQCRLICESDFIFNLMTWNSFHLARHFFRPVIPLITKDLYSRETLPHDSTKSIQNALKFTQWSALFVALLILQEEFTFAALLRVILGLSICGVPSPKFYQAIAVDQRFGLNGLELCSVYLPLLNSLTVHDKLNSDTPVHLKKPKIQYLQIPQNLQPHLDSQGNQFSNMFLTNLQETTCILTERKRLLNFKSSDSFVGFTCNESHFEKTKELCDSLLSQSFILKNCMTEEMKAELFQQLPAALRTEAINKAGTLRLLNLLSPKSFISKQWVPEVLLAKPKPYHVVPLKQSLVHLNQRAHWIVRRRRFLNEGFHIPKMEF